MTNDNNEMQININILLCKYINPINSEYLILANQIINKNIKDI
jgi:hypothetical protein